MMNKKKFVKLIDFYNELTPEERSRFYKEVDGRTYTLQICDIQGEHDAIVDTEDGKKEYTTRDIIYQLVLVYDEDGVLKNQECNFYAIEVIDEIDEQSYHHYLIPMIKVTTYIPETIIPPRESVAYIYI